MATIVTELCGRAGLDESDLDTGEIAELVPGYQLGRQTTVRSALEPLAQAFFFDAVESDDRLALRMRGREPVATIDAQDLLPMDERIGEAWRERRTQELELLERLSVVHIEQDADYGQGTQSAKRVSASSVAGSTGSRHQLSLQLPIVLDATTAKRIAERTLVAAWLERSAYEAQLPPDWLALEPTDVIDVVFPSGSRFRTRLTRVDVGADYTLALQGVSETTASFVSSAIADTGQGRLPPAVAGDAATRLIFVDLPLLRDADDTGGSASRAYYLMAGYGAPGWPGAAIYWSADSTSWTQAGRALSEAAWGAAANALGSPASPFSTDEINSLTIFVTTGGEQLESVSQEAMLAGANAALLLKGKGEPEIVQFRDVTLNPDGSYTLSGLLRGRRGTDVFADGHQAGELFVLLDASTLR